MDAVVFSAFIPTKDKVYILTEFLETFKNNFLNTDIFIGINRPFCEEAILELDKYKKILSITYEIANSHIVTPCDISGFQTALKLLKDSGNRYYLIWFGHTKGSAHNTHSIRYEFIQDFFSKRKEITSKFENDAKLGSYSKYIVKFSELDYFYDRLSQFYKFYFPYFYAYWYVFTFYVLRGKQVHNFINGCEDSFFTSNFITEKNCDLYFFERDFPHVVWRQGLYPTYDEFKDWNGGYKLNTVDIDIKQFFGEHYD